MNVIELERKLIAAARRRQPSDRVPYAFQKRVMTQLQHLPGFDGLALWAGALWRAAAACVAIVILLGALSLFIPSDSNGSNSANDLSQAFENTMLASVDQDTDYSR